MNKSELLVGTWIQVSLDTVSADGTRRPLYGENAKGMIIYTSDRYFTLMQASVDLPKLKSGLPSKATPEEAKAVIAGSIAYFGKHVLAGRDDRFFPIEFQRRVARERLGKEVEEIPGGHLVALSNAEGLTERLLRYETGLTR